MARYSKSFPPPFSTPGHERPPSPEGQFFAWLLIAFFVFLFLLRVPFWAVGHLI